MAGAFKQSLGILIRFGKSLADLSHAYQRFQVWI